MTSGRAQVADRVGSTVIKGHGDQHTEMKEAAGRTEPESRAGAQQPEPVAESDT